ncbi:MAG: hypothetical protein GY806_06295 [Gammaproteobacteria bacterium]|nr:hypothetical protein [Gammaproteobacteria bacterium]
MNDEQSCQVVEKYKQEKINTSILARIQQLIQKFEEDAIVDRRIAWIGISILMVLIAIAIYLLSSGSQVTISS